MMGTTFNSASPEDTRALASDIAKTLRGGEIIFLSGPIGAGKTVFVGGLLNALGVKARPVSASFSLMKEYKARGKKIFHIDLFRLEEREMYNFGLEEMLADEKAIILAEWPEAMRGFIKKPTLDIKFTLLSGNNRQIVCTKI